MPLPVTEDTPPDMLAGAMDIKVLLPSGRTVSMSVERSTPMMDLLVQLTTVHKLSLAGHTTVALSDSGYPLHHLPSTPLGALDTRLIHVAPRTTTLKRAPIRPNNVQPFTTTFRLQVHLPRNQLFVTRVSPDTRLADILHLACSEKNLDPEKYELRHPANLCECLSLSHTLADYRLQEVTLVASRPPGTPLTPADIMALQREEEKRRQQVKKTGGIYSIIFNKRNKGIPEVSGSVSSDSLNGRSISPARSDESIERSVSPPAPAPPLRPGRKRRPAPKPPAPSPTATTVTNLQNNKAETGVDSSKEGSTTLSHSRTSSDSSGYHEASVLSESPDTRINSSADTLPRRSKLPSTNHIVAKNKSSTLQHGTSNGGNHNLSRSLSNLTAVGINAQNMHSASTSSLASQGMMPRKKKAAPPPPAAPVKSSDTKPTQHDNHKTTKETSKPTEIVAALLHDIKTFDQNSTVSNQDNTCVDKRVPDLDKNIHKQVQVVPKLDDILDEEDIVLDLTTTKRNDVPKLERVEQISSIESRKSVIEELGPSIDVASSRIEHPTTPITSPDLVTSAIVHSPPPVVEGEEDEGLQIEIPSSIETVLRDNGLGGTSSPDIEEVPEWQYHLPAPPSAFRDLHSPTTTEFETVVLADANVFQLAPDHQSKEQNKYKPVNKFDNSNQSSTNGRREESTRDDNETNENRSFNTSPKNSHNLLSSQSSLDNNEKVVKEDESVHLSKTVVSSESDWEPQTIAIVNNVSKTKPKFNNGDLRLRQDGVTKEVYKVNPIFDNHDFEEKNVKIERVAPAKVQLEEHDVYNNKNLINRVSNTDLQLSNQLKNFTISTYNKPQNIDSIFSEDQTDSVFKMPFAPSTLVPVARTNSYSKMDKDRPALLVKRSTSHVSLARPYGKPSTFQSISRTKSISSLVREEDSGSSSLRKSTSDANLNQVEDVPLQSLQVLKAILPRLSQSQILYETGSQSQAPEPTTNQRTYTNSEIESNTLPATTKESAPESGLHSSLESKTEEEPKSEPRPFVYLGPPAINFSTWSERPKVQVSLKSDRDYRMGKQTVPMNVNSSQANSQQATKEISLDTGNINNTIDHSSSNIKNVVNKVISQNKTSVVNGTEERSTKIEPTPLTMRIVSHTSSNYRNNISLVGEAIRSSDVKMQEKANSRTDTQEERLPIVRAFELKKSRPDSYVQLRNKSSTHLNGSSSNNVANVPVNYHQGTFLNRHSYIEPGLGRNVGPVITNGSPVLTKSTSTSQINIEAPEKNFNQSKLISNGGKKYTSVIGINGSGAGSAKIIQHSASVQNLEPSTQLPRSQSVRQNFSTVKVNSFSGPKPMPIVKGFRFAGTEAANYDHGPLKISIEPEKAENLSNKHGSKASTCTPNGMRSDSKATKQPLKTINGIESKVNSKVSQTFEEKVQQRSSFILDQPDGNRRIGNNIPEPPKLPVMVLKKPTQRPPVSRFTNPRDELMDAIKNFGGRESLKSSKPKTHTNVILTI